jgi:circadian clock protein KaiC
VFVDPVTQFRYLSQNEYQFRKQVLSFLQFLKESESTVLFTSQDTAQKPDDDLQFMGDGIVTLTYEDDRRELEVTKFRGSDFDGGTHAVTISDDGIAVYPVLRPTSHSMAFSPETISSGVSELDSLLNGGIERGTATIISGPSGVGKTTTGSLFLKEAARRGERSVLYLFEESRATFVHRSKSLGIPIEEMVAEGTLSIVEVEATHQSAAEFANRVRTEVEERDARIVMVDGIEGYRLTVDGDDDAVLQNVHSLGTYLKNMGVTGLFISEVSDITGDFSVTDGQNFSYLADTILFLRYLEHRGELRKAMGVLKKRASDFERTLRGFEIREGGVHLGEPLTDMRGVLHGTPEEER